MLTREAVTDTGKATLAMERQNEIAERQQRPWLTISLSNIFISRRQEGILLICTVDIENIGATPAFQVSIDSCIGPGIRNPVPDFEVIAENVNIADEAEGFERLIVLPNGKASSQIFIDLIRADPRHPFDDGIVPNLLVWANYSLPSGARAHSSAWFTVTQKQTSETDTTMILWDDYLMEREDDLESSLGGYVRIT